MGIIKLYQSPALSEWQVNQKCKELGELIPGVSVKSLKTEYCNYIESIEKLSKDAVNKLIWILVSDFKDIVSEESTLIKGKSESVLIEIGPRYINQILTKLRSYK